MDKHRLFNVAATFFLSSSAIGFVFEKVANKPTYFFCGILTGLVLTIAWLCAQVWKK